MKKIALIFCVCGLVFAISAPSSNSQGSSAVPEIANIDLGENLNTKRGCKINLENDIFSGGVKICAVDENETMDGNFTATENNETQNAQNSDILHKSNSGVTQSKNGGVKLPFD